MQYFYHPDHLGSASFVTDREGAVCQHIQYLPFGELFVSQRNSEFDSRYKFTAKELDNETSYTYFGARYYDSDLSVWLSVDPMSDKYPGLSPYIYCLINPLMFVDPIGEIPWPILEYYKNYIRMHQNNFGAPRDKGRTHKGLDFNFKNAGNEDLGAPILATHDGIVSRVRGIEDDKDAGGNRITIISEDGNVQTSYMHLQYKPTLKEGDIVKEGDIIGYMGRSGYGDQNAWASHLHYELRINGVIVNPVDENGNLIDPQLFLNKEKPINGGMLEKIVIEVAKFINIE